jgi:Phosphodiester glycosidase
VGSDRSTAACLPVLLAVCVLCCLPVDAPAGAIPNWPAVRSSSGWTAALARGVTYGGYWVVTDAGPLSVYQLRLDLSNPGVRVGVALAHDQLVSSDETVSSMVARTGAVAGINADFFDIGGSGMPLNILVQNGALLRSPSGRVALTLDADRVARIVRFRWNGSVMFPSTHERYWLAGFNTGFVPDGMVAISNARGFGAEPPSPGVRQTVAELAPAASAYTVKHLWPQMAYYAPFPPGEVLLVGRGHAADWLSTHVAPGMSARLDLATDPDWRGLRLAVGGGPLLLQSSRAVNDPDSPIPRERTYLHPVSAAGILPDRRTMLLVAVDGRQPRRSIGLTQPQLASYLRWLGAEDAMEFDSGGSVTMAVRFPGQAGPTVVNSPSDGHERRVADALMVFTNGR